MTVETMAKLSKQAELRDPKSDNTIKTIVWPIIKRTSTYFLLGLALARHPAIPRRHKLILYGTLVYQFSPLHLLVSPIPVVGQVDCIVLLLLRRLARLVVGLGQDEAPAMRFPAFASLRIRSTAALSVP